MQRKREKAESKAREGEGRAKDERKEGRKEGRREKKRGVGRRRETRQGRVIERQHATGNMNVFTFTQSIIYKLEMRRCTCGPLLICFMYHFYLDTVRANDYLYV
jgi:hypothetical protein